MSSEEQEEVSDSEQVFTLTFSSTSAIIQILDCSSFELTLSIHVSKLFAFEVNDFIAFLFVFLLEFGVILFRGLQVLLNNLKDLGHTFTKAQINLKILDNFPKVWEPKTTIQEARNMKTLEWDGLLGILRVHEAHLQNQDHFPKRYFAALKTEEVSSRREEKNSSSETLKL